MESKEQQVNLSEYLRILFRGRWIIFISFIVIVGSTAYFTYKMRPVYQANTSIMIEETGMESSLFSMNPFINIKNNLTNQMEVLRSRTLAEQVIRSLQNSPYNTELELLQQNQTFDEKVDALRKSMAVSLIKDTDIVQMTIIAHSSFEAAFLANAIANEYYLQQLEYSKGEVSEVRAFLEEQLHTVREKLTRSEELLKRYKEEQKIASLDVETQKMVEQAVQFETLYNEAETDLQANLRRLDVLKRKMADTKSTLVDDISNITSPLILELQNQIAEKQSRIANLLAKGYPGTDETVQSIEREIEFLKSKLMEETKKIASSGIVSTDPIKTTQQLFDDILRVDIEIKSLTSRTESLREILQSFDLRLDLLPEKSLTLARLLRDAELNEKIYLMLNEKYEESRIAEAGKTANVRIIDKAKPPAKPIKPNRRLNIILGIFMGLGLGVGISFFIEFLDDSLKTVEDVEKMGLSVLGTIPTINLEEMARRMQREGKTMKDIDKLRFDARLITRFSPKSPISEAYRSLRTNIQFARLDKPVRVILITSSATKEGKSTTTANLAITLAQSGSRTLMIDGDLRRPTLHNYFQLDRKMGLTNLITGEISFEQTVKPTDIPNLFLITCGDIPPNPAELVAADQMNKVLDRARSEFDFILVDSPPLIAVTDAVIMSTRVDGLLLVVSSGFVNRREVARAISILDNVKAKVLGVLINGLDIKRIYGSYYYYYHYYQYYYYYSSSRSKSKKGGKKTSDNSKKIKA
ncbi:polysaccharide biosynthesis tyrosine autokinase [bacterium]|nr:polysaccharide biosynthesis tyrosine autokinase [FCB group bacterium]MBL7190602.1 polysaccharide biosynthesis tyrosine autokinase [bacterium]